MLGRLYIENIAVIEKAEIDFCRGFNALTGETGAGKSILIDSIMAVLGERTSRDLIRTGAASAFVSAEFSDIGAAALEMLSAQGVEPEDGCVVLSRELKADGRGTCRINGRPVNVTALKNCGKLLINIHGQHDNQALLDAQRHMGYLDSMLTEPAVRERYSEEYAGYVKLQRELASVTANDRDKLQRMENLKHHITLIEAAALKAGELDELLQKREVFINYERIRDALSSAYMMFSGSDTSTGIVGGVQEAAEEISGVSDCIHNGSALLERMKNAAYELEDISIELRDQLDGLEYDPAEQERIEKRIDLLNKIVKKYGGEVEAIEFADNARKELEQFSANDERKNELKKLLASSRQRTIEAGAALSKARRETAERFSQRIGEELRFLDMPNVRFEVGITEKSLNADGGELVEFLISANPGETPKPIHKIASGGELSRIMLAIKNVLADKDDVDTLIFDEVDTGVSGRAAHKIGVKLREVSRSRQIICITHLAQIAAQAETHMLIKKNVENGRTFTSVNRLSYEQRVHELAVINGGESITQSMLDTAAELLNAAGIKKE